MNGIEELLESASALISKSKWHSPPVGKDRYVLCPVAEWNDFVKAVAALRMEQERE